MFIYNLLSNNNYLIIIEEKLKQQKVLHPLITHISNLKHVNHFNSCVKHKL